MTNKELAAALRCCRINDCENCPARSTAIRTSAPHCYEVLLSVAAEALENTTTHVAALQQEIERLRGQLERHWISVEERLPEAGQKVLTLSATGGVRVMHLNESGYDYGMDLVEGRCLSVHG